MFFFYFRLNYEWFFFVNLIRDFRFDFLVFILNFRLFFMVFGIREGRLFFDIVGGVF